MAKPSSMKAAQPGTVFDAAEQALAQHANDEIATAQMWLAPTMAAFTALEAEHARVAPLASDFAQWHRDLARPWVRLQPGLENELMWAGNYLVAGRILAKFPQHVAEARALYAGLTVANVRGGDEQRIVERLRYAESITSVAEQHTQLREKMTEIEAKLRWAMEHGTLRGAGPVVDLEAPGRPARAAFARSGIRSGEAG